LYAWRPYSDGSMIFGAADATDRYPAFYVAKVTSHFAAGGDTIVSATSNYQRLSTFAARRADGSVSVLVINKHATATLTGSIAVAGTALAGRAVAYSYGIPQDEAARTGVGSPDISQSTISGVGTAFTRSFAPYSVTVLSLKPKLSISTTAPPADGAASVTYAQNLSAAGGAAGGYVWSLASGTLPPGVTLSGDGSLAGKPTIPGIYNFSAQAADAIGNTATQAFTITIANVPFSLWLTQNFSASQTADPAVSSAAADPDHDGQPNLLEFALNRNPLTADTPLVSVIEFDPTDGQNYLTLTYTRRKPPHDLTYHIEISSDLVTWMEDPSLVQEQSVTDDGNGLTETVKVRSLTPVATATPPRQFLLLRVTQP
ncbi:MAG: putative Ig domain-containing protein, partial [Verrucomicrobiota bacterium]